MENHKPASAFSMIELLIALCILVILGTIGITFYQNTQMQAEETVATQIQSELNTAYPEWQSSGGLENPTAANGGTSYASDLLTVIGSPPSVAPRASSNGAVKDGGTSSQISVTLPADVTAALQALPSPSAVVQGADYTVGFDGSNFAVVPTSFLVGKTWNQVGTWTPPGYTVGSQGAQIVGTPGGGNNHSFSVPEVFSVNGQSINFGNLALNINGANQNVSGTLYEFYNGSSYEIQYQGHNPGQGQGGAVLLISLTLND